MKKFFTSISLAAMTFMTTMPGMAQEQRLTDEQKAEVIATVIPAVFDQVKQISGIDILQLAKPSVKTVLESPLFGTQNLLRADAAATTLSIQPDSVIMDIKGLPLKLNFSNYKTFNLTNIQGVPVTLNFPEQITTSKILNIFQAGITIKTGEKNGLLPFSTLNIGLDLGELNFVLNWSSAKDILTLKESMKEGVFTYDIALTNDFRAALKNISEYFLKSDPSVANIKKIIEELLASPDYRVVVNMTQKKDGIINAKLQAVKGADVLPLNDVKIMINENGSKEIITTNYEDGNVEDYDRTVVAAPTVNGMSASIISTNYEAETLPEKEEDWTLESTTTTTLTNANDNMINPNNLVASIVGGILKDMITGKESSFSMNVKEKEAETDAVEKEIFSLNVTPSMDEEAIIATITTKEKGENELDIVIRIPKKGQTIKIDFFKYNDGVKNTKAAATMFTTSNLLSAVGNETITPELNVTITPAENGLYINNCENATYSIVSMSGKVIANGIISGNGAFIATPYMQRGQIYIVTIVENGAKKSIKIMK